MKRINAQASVEQLKEGCYVVHVWSDQVHVSKNYVIDAPDEKAAAFEGIDRFVREFQDG